MKMWGLLSDKGKLVLKEDDSSKGPYLYVTRGEAKTNCFTDDGETVVRVEIKLILKGGK